MRAARILTAALILAATGCLAPPPDPLWLQQRKGVSAIPDPEQRARALRQVCESAAHGGDASAVRLLLADLKDDPQHDDLASRCAVAIAGKDKDDARRIAKLIENRDARDQAVGRVEAVKLAAERK